MAASQRRRFAPATIRWSDFHVEQAALSVAQASGKYTHSTAIVRRGRELRRYFSKLEPTGNQQLAEREVVAQEILRCLVPTQPRYYLVIDEFDRNSFRIISEEVMRFSRLNPQTFNSATNPGLGAIAAACIFIGESDFKFGNVGTNGMGQIIKIDGDHCLEFIVKDPERFLISETTIRLLPLIDMNTYKPHNWGDQVKQKLPHFNTPSNSNDIQLFTPHNLTRDPLLRLEINTMIYKILLMNDQIISQLVNNIVADQDYANELINTLIERRHALKLASFADLKFQAFIIRPTTEELEAQRTTWGTETTVTIINKQDLITDISQFIKKQREDIATINTLTSDHDYAALSDENKTIFIAAFLNLSDDSKKQLTKRVDLEKILSDYINKGNIQYAKLNPAYREKCRELALKRITAGDQTLNDLDPSPRFKKDIIQYTIRYFDLIHITKNDPDEAEKNILKADLRDFLMKEVNHADLFDKTQRERFFKNVLTKCTTEQAKKWVQRQTTANNMTLLHTAILQNDYELTEYLIKKGANVNAHSTTGITPLLIAMHNRNENIAALLLRHNAEPGSKQSLPEVGDAYDQSYSDAAHQQFDTQIKRLLKYKQIWNELTDLSYKPALKLLPLSIAKSGIEKTSIDLNIACQFFGTPADAFPPRTIIHHAIHYRNMPIITLLLQNPFFDPQVKGSNGMSPLEMAAADPEINKLFATVPLEKYLADVKYSNSKSTSSSLFSDSIDAPALISHLEGLLNALNSHQPFDIDNLLEANRRNVQLINILNQLPDEYKILLFGNTLKPAAKK